MKKNILYISPNFNLTCGVSKHVFTLLTSEELKKEFNLYFITNGGDALSKLDKAGISYSLMDFKTDRIFHFDFFGDLVWLRKFCEEKEINIIHSHHRYPEYLSNKLKTKPGIKTVMTVHNFVMGFKNFSYKSDRIIAVSKTVRTHLCNYFKLSGNSIDVLYNCIIEESREDSRVSLLKSSLNISPERKIIFFTGRIIEEKGIEILVESFYKLREDSQEVLLILLGKANIPKSLLFKISADENILLLPPRETVSDFFKVADVVVLPSYKEPLGYTMLEAGLYKVPFIGSRAGGIAEFIEDGVNGYLFEPGNPNDLKEKIEYVLTHHNEAAITAERLHKKVLDECNCEKYMQKLSGIYHQLLSDL